MSLRALLRLVTGNLLVIVTVFGFLNHRQVTNIFIASLSISDFLVILFAMPFKVRTGQIQEPKNP